MYPKYWCFLHEYRNGFNLEDNQKTLLRPRAKQYKERPNMLNPMDNTQSKEGEK